MEWFKLDHIAVFQWPSQSQDVNPNENLQLGKFTFTDIFRLI